MRTRSVLIIGGGPVGLAVAALLAQDPRAERWRIRLLEPRPAPAWTASDIDLRVYALSRASQNILETAGAWEDIHARRASPYRRMIIWEGAFGAATGTLTFDSAELGEPDLGHIVEDRLIRSCLMDALAAHDNVDVLFGVELECVRADVDRVEVATVAGDILTADLLIAADGSASTVRSLLGLPVVSLPYGQQAVVAHVGTERPHAETALQRFLGSGPVALLPLVDGRSSVVWSTTTEQATLLRRADAAAYAAALTSATDGALGAITSVGERASFPLRAVHARRYCCPRVALIGDAAHTIHPLAGQGMNLGLLDAAVVAEIVRDAATEGEDPGDLRVLRRYERRQKGRNLKMLLAMDALHRLFTRAGPMLAPLRETGMCLVDAAPPAKRLLMREALGLVGELPAAARRRVA